MQPLFNTLQIVLGVAPSLGSKTVTVCQKDWVDVLSALGTPIIALMAVIIALQQWRTSEKSRRHARSERYYNNFEKVYSALESINRNAAASPDSLQLLHKARVEARIFLAKEIIDFTQDRFVKALELDSIQNRLAGEADDVQRTKLAEREAELLTDFLHHAPSELYRKYLADE